MSPEGEEIHVEPPEVWFENTRCRGQGDRSALHHAVCFFLAGAWRVEFHAEALAKCGMTMCMAAPVEFHAEALAKCGMTRCMAAPVEFHGEALAKCGMTRCMAAPQLCKRGSILAEPHIDHIHLCKTPSRVAGRFKTNHGHCARQRSSSLVDVRDSSVKCVTSMF